MNNGIIERSKNSGNITSVGNPTNQEITQGTGGIAGRILSGGTIKQCSNKGNITATSGYFVGGIVGFGEEGEILQCYNTDCQIFAKINGAGGIIGRIDNILIRNCYNYFSSNEYYIRVGNGNVGGIAGTVIETATRAIIKNSYNIGENISSENAGNRHNGSIIGGNYTSITIVENCYVLKESSLNLIGISDSNATVIEPSIKDIKIKTDAEFKKNATDTSSVAYLINNNNGAVPLWAVASNKNGNYPYLVYAK